VKKSYKLLTWRKNRETAQERKARAVEKCVVPQDQYSLALFHGGQYLGHWALDWTEGRIILDQELVNGVVDAIREFEAHVREAGVVFKATPCPEGGLHGDNHSCPSCRAVARPHGEKEDS